MTFSNNMVPCLSYGERYQEYKRWIISVRENGECQNFGYFIGFLFGHTPMHGEYIYILVWPRMASVYGHITVKSTVVPIYTYVFIFIRTYYSFIRTYEPIYVPRLSWYVDTYICFIYTYLYQCTTYMYVSDTYIQVLCWYIHRYLPLHTYMYCTYLTGVMYV